ncbi:hypothetical protein FXO38_36664 [Capsicum annuum]|nr:hypothetical protein FXO38_36664 [Capsicum annuum]KAF3664430.1 hypothetical protein FXO37_11512 [Capsicum annuum]
MLKALGERSYEIKADLLKWLEDVVLLPHPPEMERQDWRLDLAVKEEECRKAVDNENEVYDELMDLDELHEAYEKMLKDAK